MWISPSRFSQTLCWITAFEEAYFYKHYCYEHLKVTNPFCGQGDYKAAYPGEWNLSWTLQGSSEIRKVELDEKIGNTGATIKSAEISPISARITMDWPYSEDPERQIVLAETRKRKNVMAVRNFLW